MRPPQTAAALAALLKLPCRGDGSRVIEGAAALEAAEAGELSFVSSPKYFAAARASAAGCLIGPPEYEESGSQTILESPQPRAHFAAALQILYPAPRLAPGIDPNAMVDGMASIDPSAEIGPGAVIARGAVIHAHVRVGAGCCIGEDTVVGERTILHPRVTLYHRVSVGARCILHSGVVVGADGFGFELAGGRYHKVPQVGTVTIGNDVELGANTCVDRATLGATVIGDGAKLDNMVHIAHNCRIGKHVVIAAQTGLAGGVSIGDYAVVGGQVGVGDKARIEARAIIGSGAGILTSKIVRAGEPVWGTPARPLRQYLAQLAVVSRLAKRRGSQ